MPTEPEPEEVPFFAVRSRPADGTTVVALEGDLDLSSAPEAGEALSAAQAAGGPVVLDLRALRFIDSSGVHLVLDANRRAARTGGEATLRVVPGDGEVRRVFELSGVGGLLTLVDAPPPELDP